METQEQQKTIKARLRYARMSARKVRLVADLVRGMPVDEAQAHLGFLPNRASRILSKLLHSASSNARALHEEGPFLISKIYVEDGPILKRWMPRARGAASPLHKRTSHIVVELEPIREDSQRRIKRLTGISIKRQEARPARLEELEESSQEPETEAKKPDATEASRQKEEGEGRESKEGARAPRMARTKEKEAKKKGFLPRIFRRKSV